MAAEDSSGSPGAASADTPAAELVQRATEQITRLVRDELTMARAEMTAKGKRAGVGAGLLGGGATLGLYAGGALVATVVLALASIMPDALAALIVTVILSIAAAIAAQRGKKQVSKAMPATPAETRDSVRADTETIRGAVSRRQP
ncbi:phage holin family protein [Micromonospora sp. 4G57]|uniref:Phage holin family protein n=1 Tax=Micromonospora sicca TaxID=2202420 RepID=A0ABU5JAW4_9ACTN|nr:MULTISPECIES: phage holin family protein [unclassified Micromonospora]MDZ5444443.1 phage holin family protein [Micromonospora sp. 4G57]MDZ5489723.1 phage holin family protein [Micromonospora sp. 4G53]